MRMLGTVALLALAAATVSADRVVYVGTYSPNAFVYAQNGTLLQTVPNLDSPSWLEYNAAKRIVLAANEIEIGRVTSFSVGVDGKLTRLNERPSQGHSPCSIAVDPCGRFAAVANYFGHTFTILPIGADGRLSPASDVAKIEGLGPNVDRQDASHPHDVVFHAAAKMLFAVDLGVDRVFAYKWDCSNASFAGRFSPAAPMSFAQLTSGSGPRHLRFHATLPFAYLATELTNTVVVFAVDVARGTLRALQSVSTLPGDAQTLANTAAELAITPNGRFLYVSNRGHESLAAFAIDQSTGLLRSLGWTPTLAKMPRSFAIDPSGTLLIVAGQSSENLVWFDANPTTGELKSKFSLPVPQPTLVAFGPETWIPKADVDSSSL